MDSSCHRQDHVGSKLSPDDDAGISFRFSLAGSRAQTPVPRATATARATRGKALTLFIFDSRGKLSLTHSEEPEIEMRSRSSQPGQVPTTYDRRLHRVAACGIPPTRNGYIPPEPRALYNLPPRFSLSRSLSRSSIRSLANHHRPRIPEFLTPQRLLLLCCAAIQWQRRPRGNRRAALQCRRRCRCSTWRRRPRTSCSASSPTRRTTTTSRGTRRRHAAASSARPGAWRRGCPRGTPDPRRGRSWPRPPSGAGASADPASGGLGCCCPLQPRPGLLLGKEARPDGAELLGSTRPASASSSPRWSG